MLVFLNPAAASETGSSQQRPDDARALPLDDSTGLAAAGLSLLPEADFGLGAEADRLRASRRYTLLQKLSWVQENPPASGGPALRLLLPAGDGVSGLEGWLRLNAGRFPRLEADLEYTALDADGLPRAFHLHEKRKMPQPVVHYLDSARLGVLAKVTRLP